MKLALISVADISNRTVFIAARTLFIWACHILPRRGVGGKVWHGRFADQCQILACRGFSHACLSVRFSSRFCLADFFPRWFPAGPYLVTPDASAARRRRRGGICRF